jgi:hypothetical protein
MNANEVVETGPSNESEKAGDQLRGGEKKAAGAARPEAKASPEQVIGRKRKVGRLNKRLILGVIAALVIGMLVLNFLPTDKKGKGAGDSADAVYANDRMPQDVKDMAMKLPEVKLTSASPTPASRYGQTSALNNPFAGYASETSETKPTFTRSATGDSTSGASKDYQGMAASDARLEAERVARRAPMEVATKLTAGLTVGAPGQAASPDTKAL